MLIRRPWLLSMFACAVAVYAETECISHAPCYTEAGIVNLASNVSGALAPNTLATIYGMNLSYSTRAISGFDLRGNILPIELSGSGVRVQVGPLPALMYYVSPTQVNLLIPSDITAGDFTIQLVREGWAGPPVRITLHDVAPALFQMDAETVVSTRADFSLISEEAPAHPGDYVILWATGLGRTVPPTVYGHIPLGAAIIQRLGEFRVLLDGVAVDAGRIGYAGVAPGYGGLYQINFRLPAIVSEDPEIQIAIGDEISPRGLRLPLRLQEQEISATQ
jgi:uncharacterized protein (TIGR03437 family)